MHKITFSLITISKHAQCHSLIIRECFLLFGQKSLTKPQSIKHEQKWINLNKSVRTHDISRQVSSARFLMAISHIFSRLAWWTRKEVKRNLKRGDKLNVYLSSLYVFFAVRKCFAGGKETWANFVAVDCIFVKQIEIEILLDIYFTSKMRNFNCCYQTHE